MYSYSYGSDTVGDRVQVRSFGRLMTNPYFLFEEFGYCAINGKLRLDMMVCSGLLK